MASRTVLIAPGEPETGLWCPDCQLPTRIRVPLTVITEDGASDTALPAPELCTACGRRYR